MSKPNPGPVPERSSALIVDSGHHQQVLSSALLTPFNKFIWDRHRGEDGEEKQLPFLLKCPRDTVPAWRILTNLIPVRKGTIKQDKAAWALEANPLPMLAGFLRSPLLKRLAASQASSQRGLGHEDFTLYSCTFHI